MRKLLFALAMVAACGGDGDDGGGPGPNPTPTPQRVGDSIRNPAPFDSSLTVTFEDAGRTFIASIQPLEMFRGAAAVQRIRSDWGFASDPDPGFEFIVVRATFRLDHAAQQLHLFSFDFDAFTGDGAEYETCACIDPRPELEGDVFAGGTLEGWVTFAVRQSDQRPVMTFGRDFLTGRGGGWWKLYN